MRYKKMGNYMNMTYRERAFAGEKNIVMDALKSMNSNATISGIAAVVKNKPDDEDIINVLKALKESRMTAKEIELRLIQSRGKSRQFVNNGVAKK